MSASSPAESATAITIRPAGPQDAERVSALACATFSETFAHLYRPQDLQAFLDTSYGPERLAAELADPAQRWWLAEDRTEAGAYLQTGPCGLPHPDARPEHGELKRLYVRRAWQGRGMGRRLLEVALEDLDTRFDRPAWIGVWSENAKAQALYASAGFRKVGEYLFAVGEARDLEFILRRD